MKITTTSLGTHVYHGFVESQQSMNARSERLLQNVFWNTLLSITQEADVDAFLNLVDVAKYEPTAEERDIEIWQSEWTRTYSDLAFRG